MARTIGKFSSTLAKILKACGMQSRLHEYRIFARWDQSVGPAIARHAQPKLLRGGKLSLIVDSPAWMQQLTLMKPDLVERLNKDLGGNMVKDISFRLGDVEEARAQPSDDILPPAALSEEDRVRIEQHVRSIDDENTREALRRLLEKDVSHKKRVRGRD